MLLVEIILFYW